MNIQLPDPEIRRVNNVTTVGPYSISGGEITAARLGYLHGAETVAKMFAEKIRAQDLAGLLELMNATETKRFYDHAI